VTVAYWLFIVMGAVMTILGVMCLCIGIVSLVILPMIRVEILHPSIIPSNSKGDGTP
jgi:hypothetical protein